MFSLEGTTAVVTGAGSGIGQAIAQLFVLQGAVVAAVDIDEVAALALYLCSDEASFVTGQANPIDGGVLAQ
jgi:NAD(P)-dependent dehydrogenase (short-subunit alcohol dehydrogenase family)